LGPGAATLELHHFPYQEHIAMELLRCAIHRLCALVLCWSLCFPAPLAAAQDASENQPSASQKHRAELCGDIRTQLQGDARILHALNRLTFGPRDGDLEAVRAMGPGEIGLDKWFDGQLHPENIDETDLNARLAEYPAMQWSTQDLMFRMPGPAIIRQAVDGKIEIPRGGTLHAVYENQIYRYQLRKAAQADKQVSKPASQQVSGPADTGNPSMSAAAPAASATAPAGSNANMESPANSSASPGGNPIANPNPNPNIDTGGVAAGGSRTASAGDAAG
jgi:hypothetical protein